LFGREPAVGDEAAVLLFRRLVVEHRDYVLLRKFRTDHLAEVSIDGRVDPVELMMRRATSAESYGADEPAMASE
jgi:hypothetical protein